MSAASPLRLSLLRHAHAEPQHPHGTDESRALDRRGVAEAAEMARRLQARGLKPDWLLVSTAVRTRQTAAPIVRAFSLAEDCVRFEAALYLADPRSLLTQLHSVPAHALHVLLVGHNPGISELAQRLATSGHAPEFEPAGWLLGLPQCASWRELDAGQLEVLQYDAPRIPFELDD